MPTATYDLLASNELTSSASSVTFSSISGSYRDLVLVFELTGGNGDVYPRIRANSDTGTNYSYIEMYASGSNGSGSQGSYYSNSENGYQIYGAFATTTAKIFYVCNFFDYAQSKHKMVLARGGRPNNKVNQNLTRWASTSAITSLTIDSTNGSTIASGSSFYLFGLVA